MQIVNEDATVLYTIYIGVHVCNVSVVERRRPLAQTGLAVPNKILRAGSCARAAESCLNLLLLTRSIISHRLSVAALTEVIIIVIIKQCCDLS